MPEESLRPSYQGRFADLNIIDVTMLDILYDERFALPMKAHFKLASECNGCVLLEHCQSGRALGRVGMRFSSDSVYDRKSSYCKAFIDLYTEVAATLARKGISSAGIGLQELGVLERPPGEAA